MKASQLNSFTYLDGRVEVTLLSSGNEVIEEGRVMRHCVGSYADSCIQEQYAVFSLKSASGRSTAGIAKHGGALLSHHRQSKHTKLESATTL